MKTLSFCAVMTVLFTLAGVPVLAQGQITGSAGLDIMIPVGDFSNHWGTGFGGTAEIDYALSPRTSITGKIGYLTWSGSNLPSGVTATYGGVPILVGVKFCPPSLANMSVRPYGHLELGFMAGTFSYTGHYTAGESSGADFTIVPSLGCAIPAGEKGKIDVSVRYFDISRKASIGFRAGYEISF
jgi:hypothetical protein